jgi:hypothetical protein
MAGTTLRLGVAQAAPPALSVSPISARSVQCSLVSLNTTHFFPEASECLYIGAGLRLLHNRYVPPKSSTSLRPLPLRPNASLTASMP